MQSISGKDNIPQGWFFIKPPSYILGYRFADGFTAAVRLWPLQLTTFWISPCKYDAPPRGVS